MIHAFLFGMFLCIGLIVPLGVQNIFIFNQGALHKRFIQAFPSIITAALCDTFLILISILGISLLILTIPWIKIVIFLIGFVFLSYMGWQTWIKNTTTSKIEAEEFSAKRQIIFASSVSLLNPHALLDTVTVIGTNSLHFIGDEKFAFTVACVLVSWVWFFSLSLAGHMVHKIDSSGIVIKWINKISAIIIWAIAVYLGVALIKII